MNKEEKIWMSISVPLLMGTVYLAGIKGMEALDWSWWVVCAPLLVMAAILIILALGGLVVSSFRHKVKASKPIEPRAPHDAPSLPVPFEYKPSALMKVSGVLATVLGFLVFAVPRWTPIEYPLWITVTAFTFMCGSCTIGVVWEIWRESTWDGKKATLPY